MLPITSNIRIIGLDGKSMWKCKLCKKYVNKNNSIFLETPFRFITIDERGIVDEDGIHICNECLSEFLERRRQLNEKSKTVDKRP